MTEGKIEIPPPVGLLDTDSYSAKANRVTSATSVTTTFEYTIIARRGPRPEVVAPRVLAPRLRAAPEVGALRVPPGESRRRLALARRRVLGGRAYYCGHGFLASWFGDLY